MRQRLSGFEILEVHKELFYALDLKRRGSMAFDWLKRKRKPAARPKRRLPERHLAPVEEIVEQGLLVADVAVRMSVKNAIILNALGEKVDYDKSQIESMVKDSAMELAVERERDARHISRMRAEIRKSGYSTWSENDYGSEDNATLRHRQEVYEQVAKELRERAENTEYLATTAERSRVAAWKEIGDSLKEKASHPYYAGGASEEYKKSREARIELLIQRDLTALVKKQSQKNAPETKRKGFLKRGE